VKAAKAAALLLAAACTRHAQAAPSTITIPIDCAHPLHRISPLIYGVSHSQMSEPELATPAELPATAVRWGGNTNSRYNWELGNAWNAASDWEFRNVNYTGREGPAWKWFLDGNRAGGLATAMTIPILGWVARDTTSAPPQPTSVEAPPEMMERWVRAMGHVEMVILDNEPMLWNETHRDVHPQPVGYDELLDRTIRYGSAVRRADPKAVIAGPALWGWPAYFYSAIDKQAGFRRHPDRRAHGDVPLLPWYLEQLRRYEQRTGTRLLDVVDVHFYPQGEGIGMGARGATDRETAARRVRSVRGLWDPTYRDESWIDAPIRLLPRLHAWIDESYPGRGISIGEYNFGAETHISGGLALAEALGRFAEGGITSAFYWTTPVRGSPAFHAFRAYRNFDGAGARFEDVFLGAPSSDRLSFFIARNEASTRVTIVAVNGRDEAVRFAAAPRSCELTGATRQFVYVSGATGLTPRAEATLPPQSFAVIELR
jgi:hypothetical protein